MKSMFKIIISLFTVMFICSSNIFAVDYFARVILVGDAASGKTSLWRRLFGEKFDMSQNASDMMVRRDIIKNIDGKEVQFNIWDTAGAESYYDEVVNFTKGAPHGGEHWDVSPPDGRGHADISPEGKIIRGFRY